MSATKPTIHLARQMKMVIWSSWQNKKKIVSKACGGPVQKGVCGNLKGGNRQTGLPVSHCSLPLSHDTSQLVLACHNILLCMPRE